MRNVTTSALGGALFIGLGLAGSANAATIDFGISSGNRASYVEDGFTFAPARLVNGNCLGGACLALNTNETTTLTFGSGSAFTLGSFGFNLLGRPAELTVTGSNGASAVFTTDEYGFNTYNTAVLGPLFTGVTSIVFDDTGTGNIRIDDLIASPLIPGGTAAPVPLPATGLLLLAGLGTLVAARRRTR